MSKIKNKKRFKIKYKNKNNNKKQKKMISSQNQSQSLVKNTVLSRKNVSGNWITFMKSNGVKGKVFNVSSAITKEASNNNNNNQHKTPAVTKVVALDCEMVSDMDDQSMLARVSIVNYKLECLYDKYVKPTSKVGDYRTRFSGIRQEDLENGHDFETVCQEVKTILYNKILVGHALHNDFRVLKFGHHQQLIRDTATYKPFQEACETKNPSLKKLAKVLLNENVQEGEHNSIEDAKTAMKLYKKFKKEWEVSLIKTKKDVPTAPVNAE